LAQFAYNSAASEATGHSPFYLNYRYQPVAYRAPFTTDHLLEQAVLKVVELKNLQQDLKTDLEFLQARTAHYYNKKRIEGPTLKEGDRVYLLRKNFKTQRPSDKLDFKKLGPFAIKKVIRPVNYELKLLKTMEMHLVFHISLLEPAPNGAPRVPDTDIIVKNTDTEYDVEKILDSKYVRHTLHYLVKWLDCPDAENSWEPATNLSCPKKLEEFHRRNPAQPRTIGPGPVQGRGRRGRLDR
jgi:hypothetical protein